MSLWQRFLLVVLLGAAVGLAKQALAQVITEFPVPTANSYPRGIVTGPDGALWFTEPNANKIGRITTSGVITEFPVGGIGVFYGWIAAGPDGALWFTELAANKIGRITTLGVVSEFPVPTANSAPTGIALGSDGNLWFTEVSANKIGRITTAGVITEFAIPTAGSGAWLITAGPDGALWFDEFYTNKIGRITTSGIITEFPVPTSNSGPSGITTGPDGALWFCEQYADKIGRITTAGIFTEFPIPTSGANSEGITVGPDGALWFAEAVSNGKIGRITLAGVVTEFKLPAAGGLPFGVVTGPDGSLWFTDYANNIGRLSLPPYLQVSPSTDLAVSGSQGGPFSPTSFKYQLASTNGSIDYSIFGIPSWLNASFTSGTATTSPITLTLSLINVGSLTPGTYAATIAFTNLDTGQGSQNRIATLTVNPPGLNVTPTTGIAASGTHGGPFSPSSFTYTLSATFGSVNYSIITPSWLTASSKSGTVTTSAKHITVAVNSSARNLAPNTYSENVDFYNTTNNQGNTTRVATLIVDSKDYKVTVRASPITDGTVTGGGEVAEGSSTTVTATANSGHSFVHWTENGRVVSTTPIYTFTMPRANVALVADFH